jgi:hypothetical protein
MMKEMKSYFGAESKVSDGFFRSTLGLGTIGKTWQCLALAKFFCFLEHYNGTAGLY